MSLPVILDPDAQAEFDEGYDFYEGRRDGLGDEFADAIEVVLERIGNSPFAHTVALGNVRKAVVSRFPFCVYYRPEVDRVRVLAVFHTSRDPGIWQARAVG